MSVADAGCFLGVAVSSAVVLTTRTSGMHTNTLAGMHNIRDVVWIILLRRSLE